MASLELSPAGQVLWFDQPACADPDQVGGKAAQLAKLARFFPVPPGFCLPASLVASVLAEGDARERLRGLVAPAYARLAQLAETELPRVAVRSSAVDEDGAQSSFAGQHETYLNLTGDDQIAEAVLRCWDSGSSERALAYRAQFGLADEALRLAVLVQQLVRSDVSAVVFSANPVSGARDEIVVTASLGLGESLVGGTVTPDTWTVAKEGLQPRDEILGDKRRMTIATAEGTREVDVPQLLRRRACLSPEQVAELAALAAALEQFNGWPVDVEAAFSQGRLYLLQCRPITAGLKPADDEAVQSGFEATAVPAGNRARSRERE